MANFPPLRHYGFALSADGQQVPKALDSFLLEMNLLRSSLSPPSDVRRFAAFRAMASALVAELVPGAAPVHPGR
jgi:hypothetical protein